MSIFQFAKLQRVTVPPSMAGADNVQGLIAEGHAELGCDPRYILQWPNAEKIGDNGLFTIVVGEVSQDALAKAQPPKMMTEAEAADRAQEYHNKHFKIGVITGRFEERMARRHDPRVNHAKRRHKSKPARNRKRR